jgi:hypothetical protein
MIFVYIASCINLSCLPMHIAVWKRKFSFKKLKSKLRNSILNTSLLSFTIETSLSFRHPRITILATYKLSAFRTARFRGLYFPLSRLRNFIEYVTRAEINVHMAHGENFISLFFTIFSNIYIKIPTAAVCPKQN